MRFSKYRARPRNGLFKAKQQSALSMSALKGTWTIGSVAMRQSSWWFLAHVQAKRTGFQSKTTSEIRLSARLGGFCSTSLRIGSKASAAQQLIKLAVPRSAGLFLGSRPKRETIASDLLPVTRIPEKYYIGATDHGKRKEVADHLKEETGRLRWDWILNSHTLHSFHDLSEKPWDAVCDRGTVEAHDTSEWAATEDSDKKRSFVELLNQSLGEFLYRCYVRFDRSLGIYYFSATPDLSSRKFRYRSRAHWTSRVVFKGYPSTKDPTRMKYYRHSAFEGQFFRFDDTWFLRVRPTYHFTRDGRQRSKYAGDNLAGIKRLENNQAVHGQTVMWAEFLRQERSLFEQDEPSFLGFGEPLSFQVEAGVDDAVWIKHEPSENQVLLSQQQS